MTDYDNHQRLMLLIFEAMETGFEASNIYSNGETMNGDDPEKIILMKEVYDDFLIAKGLVKQNDK